MKLSLLLLTTLLFLIIIESCNSQNAKKKTPAKKQPAKKAPAKKAVPAKKAPAKKTPTKKPAPKKQTKSIPVKKPPVIQPRMGGPFGGPMQSPMPVEDYHNDDFNPYPAFNEDDNVTPGGGFTSPDYNLPFPSLGTGTGSETGPGAGTGMGIGPEDGGQYGDYFGNSDPEPTTRKPIKTKTRKTNRKTKINRQSSKTVEKDEQYSYTETHH